MKTIYHKLTFLAIVFSMAFAVSAQYRAYRVTDTQVQAVITRIETRTDTFRRQIERYERRNNSQFAEQLTEYVTDFENATDALTTNFTSRKSSADDVQAVLNRAAVIDAYMRDNQFNAATESQWNLIRTDLNTLAGYYRVSWNWDTTPTYPNTQKYPSYSVSDAQVQAVITRIETRTDALRRQVDRFSYRNATLGKQLETLVDDFENSTDKLDESFTSRNSTSTDVEQVLTRGAYIENFLRANRVNYATQNQWNQIRTDLNSLAGFYRVSWNWDRMPTLPGNTNYPRGFDARLTGTYRLNASLSDNVTVAIDRVLNNTNDINQNTQRERARTALERRLTPPDMLAIEKNGQKIMLASTLLQQVSFNADGISRSETNQNGRTVQTRVTATNSDLTIDYEGDRMNDFYVSFTPLNNGQLRVTRRVYLENRNETITVNSIYDKTDQIARFDSIDYRNNNNSTNYPNNDNGNINNEFIVANNTRILATLDTPLSTRTFRDGDRFSMTVTSPGQYQGAVIEGRVNGSKSGVVSGRANLTLDFDTIRLRNGNTFRFAGIVDQVREPDGDMVSVNNEGTVRDSNQTKKTVTRAGIGAVLGAIIGAIAGGGEGAVIGAGVGAGAGAGSVILQGKDNLELPSGTEFSVTATAPVNR